MLVMMTLYECLDESLVSTREKKNNKKNQQNIILYKQQKTTSCLQWVLQLKRTYQIYENSGVPINSESVESYVLHKLRFI